MSRVDATARVRIYEVEGVAQVTFPELQVHTHWNDRGRVDIEVGGKRYTVVARDLIAAIEAMARASAA